MLGDSGWKVGLSPDIPIVFKRVLPNFCKSLVDGEAEFNTSQWAIHPGGKSVVEIIEQSFQLSKDQTNSTWKILGEKGNMSSGTVLFILDELRRETNSKHFRDVITLAFGPGLAMEGALLRKISDDF